MHLVKLSFSIALGSLFGAGCEADGNLQTMVALDEYLTTVSLVSKVEEPSLLECDGYFTNNTSKDYCSEDVPEDWQSFEFDGLEYHFVPLAGVVVEFSHTNKSLQQTGND